MRKNILAAMEQIAAYFVKVLHSRFNEFTLLALGYSIIVILFIDPILINDVLAYVSDVDNQTPKKFIFLIVLLLGFCFSIYHAFSREDKSDLEMHLMFMFFLMGNMVISYSAIQYALHHSWKWHLWIPLWNIVVFLFRVPRGAAKGEYEESEMVESNWKEIASGILLVSALLGIAHWLHMHWSLQLCLVQSILPPWEKKESRVNHALEHPENQHRGRTRYRLGIDGDNALVAPCGINCRVCMDQKWCLGCRVDERRSRNCLSCSIANCSDLTGSTSGFCHDCDRFPCRTLRNLDGEYRETYCISPLDNLRSIKEDGLEAFVKKENGKWQCPDCGKAISFQRGYCLNRHVKGKKAKA